MSIEQLEKKMIATPTMNENLEKQKHTIQKAELLNNIYSLLEDTSEDEEIIFDEEIEPALYTASKEIEGSKEMLEDIKTYFPRTYTRMRKNADNIVPILQEFETKKEHHQKTIEKDTKKVRKVLYAIVDDTIQQNKLEIRKLSRDNLINILINSPQQDIQIALKKTREIENKHLTTQPEHERIESNETQETLFEKEKKRISQLIYFPTHFSEAAPTKDIPEIPYSTTCQIFYYEEDYYDAVSRQTLLIDISQNTIKFSDNDVKIFTKDDIVQNKIWEMDMREITHDNLDYYFIYYHRGKGNQYIGWISLKKNYGTPTLHIFNTQNRLRYGTKYINKYNAQYREWSCTEDGDVLPGLVAKDTADNIEIRYGMR